MIGSFFLLARKINKAVDILAKISFSNNLIFYFNIFILEDVPSKFKNQITEVFPI